MIHYGKNKSRFHLSCWAERLVAILDEHAPAGKPGRKPLEMTPEQKEVRSKLIRAYAAAKHRLKQLEGSRDSERIEFYRNLMVTLTQQIECYGGRPHKWK